MNEIEKNNMFIDQYTELIDMLKSVPNINETLVSLYETKRQQIIDKNKTFLNKNTRDISRELDESVLSKYYASKKKYDLLKEEIDNSLGVVR